MVPLSYYLVLSGFLFACGVAGFLIKRNIITIFMSIELMLNGVNLSFVAFAAHWHALAGQVFVFFVMVVAAAEAAVEGAKKTEAIVARMGRAGTVGERSIGYPDAGAHALGVIFTGLAKALK